MMVTTIAIPGDAQVDRDSLGRLMANDLADMLELDPSTIDPSKSFDEYGLDSIDAIIATDLLGRRLGIELAPEFLICNPSLNEVVKAIFALFCEDVGREQGPQGVPLFLISGGGGRDRRMAQLVNLCEPHFTGNFLSLGLWSDWIAKDIDFLDLVEESCHRIRSDCAGRPYMIAGYSQGGQLAYAVSCRLQDLGEPATALLLLDTNLGISKFQTWLAKPFRGAVSTSGRLVRRIVSRVFRDPFAKTRNLPQDEGGGIYIYALYLFASWFDSNKMRRFIALAVYRYKARITERRAVRLDDNLQAIYFDIMWRSWMRSHSGFLTKATDTFFFKAKSDVDIVDSWRSYCEHIETIDVAGDHVSILDEDIGDLAQKMINLVTAADPSLSGTTDSRMTLCS